MAQVLAQYEGICPACELQIRVGQPITFSDEHGSWLHAECPDDPFTKPAGDFCLHCLTYHPGEC